MSDLVTTHIVPGSPMAVICVEAADPVGPGGAYNRYLITGFDKGRNPLFGGDVDSVQARLLDLFFQHGDPADGPNGITMEALLAICAHRLQGFQNGPWPHPNNESAMRKILSALDDLKAREASYLQLHGKDMQPERVLDNEGTRGDEQWKTSPARFVPPEQVTVEVHVSVDARQAGSTMIANHISQMLRERGYTNVNDLELHPDSDAVYKSDPTLHEQAFKFCVDANGQEKAERIYDTYKHVVVKVIRDFKTSKKKTHS